MKRMRATAPKRLSFIRSSKPLANAIKLPSWLSFATGDRVWCTRSKAFDPAVAEHAHGVKIKGVGDPQRSRPYAT